MQGVVRRLSGERLKSLRILLPAVSFHTGELTKARKVWPDNPTAGREATRGNSACLPSVWELGRRTRQQQANRPVRNVVLFGMPPEAANILKP